MKSAFRLVANVCELLMYAKIDLGISFCQQYQKLWIMSELAYMTTQQENVGESKVSVLLYCMLVPRRHPLAWILQRLSCCCELVPPTQCSTAFIICEQQPPERPRSADMIQSTCLKNHRRQTNCFQPFNCLLAAASYQLRKCSKSSQPENKFPKVTMNIIRTLAVQFKILGNYILFFSIFCDTFSTVCTEQQITNKQVGS